MATQVQTKARTSTKNPTFAMRNLSQYPSTATTESLSTLDAFTTNLTTSAKSTLDRFFTPEQRQNLRDKIEAFVQANPKLSVRRLPPSSPLTTRLTPNSQAFLAINLALTAIPIACFTLFALSVALFSISSGILLGLLAGVSITLFWVGVAFAIVLPVVVFTTASACFLFVLGLGGYWILRWVRGKDQSERESTGQNGTAGGEHRAYGGMNRPLDLADVQRKQDGVANLSNRNRPLVQPPAQQMEIKRPIDTPAGTSDTT